MTLQIKVPQLVYSNGNFSNEMPGDQRSPEAVFAELGVNTGVVVIRDLVRPEPVDTTGVTVENLSRAKAAISKPADEVAEMLAEAFGMSQHESGWHGAGLYAPGLQGYGRYESTSTPTAELVSEDDQDPEYRSVHRNAQNFHHPPITIASNFITRFFEERDKNNRGYTPQAKLFTAHHGSARVRPNMGQPLAELDRGDAVVHLSHPQKAAGEKQFDRIPHYELLVDPTGDGTPMTVSYERDHNGQIDPARTLAINTETREFDIREQEVPVSIVGSASIGFPLPRYD